MLSISILLSKRLKKRTKSLSFGNFNLFDASFQGAQTALSCKINKFMENNEKEKAVRKLFGNMHKEQRAPVSKKEQKQRNSIESNSVLTLFCGNAPGWKQNRCLSFRVKRIDAMRPGFSRM